MNEPVFKSTATTEEELVEAIQFAALNEYNYVSDASGSVYQITEYSDEDSDEDDTDTEDYCINCHNLLLIDQIINNTLMQQENITLEQTQTMLNLAQLKRMLGDM